MTKTEAIEKALVKVNASFWDSDDVLVAVEEGVLERSYGWVVPYQSRAFLETGDERRMLAGNAPCVVLHDGAIHLLGTALPVEEELAKLESDLGLG